MRIFLYCAGSRMGFITLQPYEITRHRSEMGELVHAVHPHPGTADVGTVSVEETAYENLLALVENIISLE